MSTETITYEGDDIIIEEMPQGCVLTQVSHTGRGITIASTQDALAVIESLPSGMVNAILDNLNISDETNDMFVDSMQEYTDLSIHSFYFCEDK